MPQGLGHQRHPLTRTHVNPELQSPFPRATKWEQIKQNRVFFLPFFMTHEGDGWETSGWDGHREATLVPSCS